MALIFADGFGYYNSASMTEKWDDVAQIRWAIAPGMGRRGNPAALQGGSGYPLVTNLKTPLSTIITGAAFYFGGGLGNTDIFRFTDAGNIQFYVLAQADGSITVRNTSFDFTLVPPNYTILGATNPGVLRSNSWNYIEIKVVFGVTTGAVTIRVNEVQKLNISDVATQHSSNAYCTSVGYSVPSAGNCYLNDLYICDTTTATCNDFLGDISIDARLPVADGHYKQLTPSVGTAHWSLVNGVSPDITSYLSSSVTGSKDSYIFAAASNENTLIYGVQINVAANRDGSGSRSVSALTRVGTTDVVSAPQPVGTSQLIYSAFSTVDPSTGTSWTPASLATAEFGPVVI